MKIICISGYSGAGKTTMIKLMQKYLSNVYFITKNEEITQIKNPSELEKIYGLPVNTDHTYFPTSKFNLHRNLHFKI